MSHVRHLFAVGAAVLAIAPAAAQTFPYPDPRGVRCIAEAVQRLDDQTSDARTVAAAAVASCRSARIRAIREIAPERDDIIERALDELREQDVDGTSAVVLEHRRRSR